MQSTISLLHHCEATEKTNASQNNIDFERTSTIAPNANITPQFRFLKKILLKNDGKKQLSDLR